MTHPNLSETLAQLARALGPARKVSASRQAAQPGYLYIYSDVSFRQFRVRDSEKLRAALYGINGYTASFGNRPREGFDVCELTEREALEYLADRKAIAAGGYRTLAGAA